MKWLFLLVSHLAVGVLGVGLGIYLLPILTQPDSPDMAKIERLSQDARYTGQFERARKDSDFLHWGEGEIKITNTDVVFQGKLAPGPDYKLYLSPIFVESEADFATYQSSMVQIGDVKTFDRFTLKLPEGVNIDQYNTAVVWCESFGEFISSAKYQ
ncbi:DM13 domain-containing protein [Vibrio proteolyticus]